MIWLDGPSDAPPQAAFAIGRRVGSAVVRNRLRRRLRSVLDEEAREGRLRGHYLISAAPEAASLPYGELAAYLGQVIDSHHRGIR